MSYKNGLDREAFLQHLADEFPLVFMNSFAREMVENVVDYCLDDNFTHSKNARYYFLMDMIPEITPADLLPYMDHRTLTGEVLDLVDEVEELVEVVDDEEPVVVRTMDELKDYLEENGWWVSECEFGGGHVGWEIGQASPAGEDFFFAFEHDNDVKKAIDKIKQYAYDFDIDEHVQLNLGQRGAPGAVELVKDAKEIQKMLDELADGVNWSVQKSLRETIQEANARTVHVPGSEGEQEYGNC